jgi:hypothetical protein
MRKAYALTLVGGVGSIYMAGGSDDIRKIAGRADQEGNVLECGVKLGILGM